MHKNLLKLFIERKYIQEFSEIDAPHPRRKITDGFIVRGISPYGSDDYKIVVADCVDGSLSTILGSTISGVDGMAVERLAEVYDLSVQGEAIISVEQKRGRKTQLKAVAWDYSWEDDDEFSDDF